MINKLKNLGINVQQGRSDHSLKLQQVASSDFWVKGGDDWRRKHLKKRVCLFTPMKVVGGPSNSADVGDIRITMGTTKSGRKFVIKDLWKEQNEPHRRVEEFVGETWFISEGGQPCA